MKTKNLMLGAALICAVSACKKQSSTPELSVEKQSVTNVNALVIPPPSTWQEHWFDHTQLLNLKFSDANVAVYYDNDVATSITWPNTFVAQVWNYTKLKYGAFGEDSKLFAVFHTGKYSGGHPSTYFDESHDYRNAIDLGSNSTSAWLSGTGNDLDITTHEVGHIVEGASKNVKGSPAFGIWHDSKWMEIYIYDVYVGLGRTADAQRWYNLVLNGTESYPRANTQWFKNWFYPIYAQLGSQASLNNFFTLLSQHFPKHTSSNANGSFQEYTGGLNMGQFIHFWSGATGVDLKPLALTAFGNLDEQGNDWTTQLNTARTTFAGVTYLKDITTTASLFVSKENTAGASAAEGSSKLIDNLYSSKFFVGGYPTSFNARLTFPGTQIIKGYTLTSGNDAADRDPKSWKLSGSNDNVNYTQLDIRSNQTFAGRNETKKLTFTNTTAYKYYKLEITANNGSSDLQFSEWRLLQ